MKDGVIYPSTRVEEPGWFKDFRGSRNVISELAAVLRDMMTRTDLFNPYTSSKTGKSRYPGTPVIHPISSVIPSIRLQVNEQFEPIKQLILAHRTSYGQASSYMLTDNVFTRQLLSYAGYMWYNWRSVENKYLGVAAATKMLLQSQGGVIRLFPFYPDGTDLAFRGLRAIGGFVLDASRTQNQISADILSEAGADCRIKTYGTCCTVDCDGDAVDIQRENDIICFGTKIGRVYKLKMGIVG